MKAVKLSDITLNITDGKHGDCEADNASGFYFVSCKDVNNGKIDYENARQISESSFREAHIRTQLEPNDILLTNSGTIGRMALVRDIPETYRTTFQKSVAIIKPDTAKVLPRYLYYQLQNYVTEFVNRSNGSAQKNLLLSTMRAFDLSVHEKFETQQRLSGILSAYDDLIENNQKQIKLLEEAAQRLYKEWFVDLHFPGYETAKIVDGVPEGWKYVKAGDAIAFNPKTQLSKDRIKEYVPMSALNTTSMVLNRLDFSETQTNSGAKFQNNDTLLARITPCLENGKTAFVSGLRSDEGAVGSTEFIVMRSKMINPYMTYLYARTDQFRQTAINSMTGSDGRQRAQVSKLEAIDFLLPRKELIDRFAFVVAPMFSKIYTLCNQNAGLSQSRDHLLPKLMSGELEV